MAPYPRNDREAAAAADAGASAGEHPPEEWDLDRLLPLLYGELRELAERRLRRERADHTLQPTALVHEAYLRLAGQQGRFRNRGQFLALAAQAMRRVLVDHARRRNAEKRGGDAVRITLAGGHELACAPPADLVDLDRALTRLASLDPRQVQIAELRHFAGATIDETAEALGLSTATVEREWRMARAWLRRALEDGPRERPEPAGKEGLGSTSER